MSRVLDRMRDQFPELGEAEIQDAVGGPKSAASVALGAADDLVELRDAPRRHRA